MSDTLTSEQYAQLQQDAIGAVWAGNDEPRLSLHSLDSDGRKQKRLARILTDSGWAEEIGETGNYTLNVQPIVDTITPEEVHIIPQWEDLRENASHAELQYDYVRLNCFSVGQRKLLLERIEQQTPDQSDRILLYVMSAAPYRYTTCRHNEEAGDPEKDEQGRVKRGEYPWWGPFENIADAQAALQRARREFSGMEGYEIVVSTVALEKHAEETFFNERIDGLFKQNLLWGLTQCGIATEDELYHPKQEGDEHRKPRISVSLDDGIVLGFRGSSVGDKPVDWEANLAKSIERHQKQIEESQAAVKLLTKIQTGIATYGGWDKFKTDYRSKLEDAIRRKDAAEEAAA